MTAYEIGIDKCLQLDGLQLPQDATGRIQFRFDILVPALSLLEPIAQFGQCGVQLPGFVFNLLKAKPELIWVLA